MIEIPSRCNRICCEVNPQDIDLYGHLTYSSYAKYFAEARRNLFTNAGFDLFEIKEEGLGVLVKRCVIEYSREIKENEELHIVSGFMPYEGGLIVSTKHNMIVNGNLAATETEDNFFVRFKDGKTKAARIPKTLLAKLTPTQTEEVLK